MSVLVSLVLSTPAAGQTLPRQCKVWLPEYIANPQKVSADWTKSQKWQEWVMSKIKNNDFGKANSFVWKVYSDRANNNTYTEPNISSAVHSMLGFMELLSVAEIQNGFALVYKTLLPDDALKIPRESICFGWVPVDNLLLWEECPQTHSKIYQKALVVHDPAKHDSILEKNPPFLLEPDKNAKTNHKAIDLDIYFVMKTSEIGDSKYYLLSQGTKIGNNIQVVYGWISEEYVAEWDQRLLMEPTYETQSVAYYKKKNIYPTIFNEMEDVRQFWTNEKIQNPLWKFSDFSNNRMNSSIMRFPILEKGEISADIYSVAIIASLYSETDASLRTKLEEIIEEYKAKQETNNIDILIITTKESYLQKQKIIEILRSYNWNETEIDRYISYLKDGRVAKFVGYAPIRTSKSQHKLFDFVLFFSQDELEELIHQLSTIISPDTIYDVKAFQDAIVKMGQEVLGQFSEEEIKYMNMDRLLGQIYGIPIPLNLCGFEIEKIPYMDIEDLKDYIKTFTSKLDKLKRISSNANYDGRFQNDRTTYYWIPMVDMPGVYERCKELKIN